MENELEYRTVISELTQGMALAKQLNAHLDSVETRELLIQRILSSYERALLILRWSSNSSSSIVVHRPNDNPTVSPLPECSIFANASPPSRSSDDTKKKCYKDNLIDQKEASKKRKVTATWTNQVRVCSESGLEGTIDDGYSWRKYGQKDILGARFPRSYYRCTYRNIQNCWATKQVQRSDDDPTVFDITYKGKHACTLQASSTGTGGAPKPASPEKEEAAKQINDHSIYQQEQQHNELLLNDLRANLRVNTMNLNNEETDCLFSFPSTSLQCGMKSDNQNFPYSSTFIGENLLSGNLSSSPSSFISQAAASESSYFSVSPYQMNTTTGGGIGNNLQHSESDLTDIISAHNSATNSPIPDLDFSIFGVNLEPDFPLDTPGFFY